MEGRFGLRSMTDQISPYEHLRGSQLDNTLATNGSGESTSGRSPKQ